MKIQRLVLEPAQEAKTVLDKSQDGTDVNPDGDLVGPTNNNDPTLIEFNSTRAEDDINQTSVDIPVNGDLSTNDSDVEGDTQAVTSIGYDSDGDNIYDVFTPVPSGGSATTQVSGYDDSGAFVTNAGSITVNSDGTYTFTPVTGFTGTVDMWYEVTDGQRGRSCLR